MYSHLGITAVDIFYSAKSVVINNIIIILKELITEKLLHGTSSRNYEGEHEVTSSTNFVFSFTILIMFISVNSLTMTNMLNILNK